MPPTARQKLAWCLGAPVVAAVAFELGIRALHVAPPQRPPIQVWGDPAEQDVFREHSMHQFHAGWLWEPRPLAVFSGEQINGRAFRGPRYEVEPHPALRILALGESATFGMGRSEQESWPRVLERDLRARGVDVQVLNYGVIGHTIAQGVERYCRELRDWKADVVLCCYGGRNEQTDIGGGPTDLEKIELFDSLSMKVRMALDRFASVRWCLDRAASAPPEPSAQPADGGWRQRVSPADYERVVQRLQEATDNDHARLVFVLQAYAPWHEASASVLTDYASTISALAARRSIPLADVRAQIRASEPPDAGSKKESLLFWDDAHPTLEGSRIFAAVIERKLDELQLVPAVRAPSSNE